MKLLPVRFQFRGNRNYIQGSDIYNEMLHQLATVYDVDHFSAFRLSVHSIVSRHCNIALCPDEDTRRSFASFQAEMRFTVDNNVLTALLLHGDQPVIDRKEYDEEPIRRLCTIEEKIIKITGFSGYTPIEVAISMTKQLHERLVDCTALKPWFTKIELTRPFIPGDLEAMEIHYQHNFSNKFTKSAIYSGTLLVGHMYFSLIPR